MFVVFCVDCRRPPRECPGRACRRAVPQLPVCGDRRATVSGPTLVTAAARITRLSAAGKALLQQVKPSLIDTIFLIYVF